MILGTRGSKLALTQTEWVRRRIQAAFPDAVIEVKIIRVSADWDSETPIRAGDARGVFVRELDDALLAGAIDLAVHSMKDVPSKLPDGIEIRVIPEREDAYDALIARAAGATLGTLPRGAVVGTGSVRRRAQLLSARPDLRVEDIRGNVDTRLRKLDDGNYDAIILACAGLRRLGLEGRISSILSFDDMLPAPGQGALAIATRVEDSETLRLASPLHDPASATAVAAERAFLRRMGGGCNSPIAVHARHEGETLRIDGLVATPDGKRVVRDLCRAPADTAEGAATRLADSLLDRGGREILAAVR
jgi:hydroxymethylbilane synthase